MVKYKKLLIQDHSNINQRNIKGYKPLILALKYINDINLINLLIKKENNFTKNYYDKELKKKTNL